MSERNSKQSDEVHKKKHGLVAQYGRAGGF